MKRKLSPSNARAKRRTARPAEAVEPPEFCDFVCPSAAFPPAETAGICRTMSAVFCTRLDVLVNKNAACEWRRRQIRSNVERSER